MMIDAESLRYSPDGQHLAYVGSKSVDPNGGTTKSYFVLDDAELTEYDFPGPDAHSITFSPGGRHFAYVVTEFDMTGSQKTQTAGAAMGKTFVVVNGVQSEPFDFAMIQDQPTFESENHFHYQILVPPDKTQRVDVEIENN
jgi:dipeptidyl aminopeptidase/acylaminoacyl peptidase